MAKRRLTRRQEVQPDLPDLGALKILHRAHDGFVHLQAYPLGRRFGQEGDPPVPVRVTIGNTYTGSVPVSVLHEWATWLPQVRESLLRQLLIDGYAGVNTAYSPKPWPGSDDFRRLNAALVDCDCYDLEYEQAFARVAQLVADRHLPNFSLVMNTGHGLHVFWLLHGDDERPHLPPRSRARNRALLVDINRALIDRVTAAAPELRPDPGATAVTTHTRVPGSRNTRANATVAMTLNIGHDGTPPTYTLDDLRQFLQLPERVALARPRRQLGEGDEQRVPDERKVKGHRARWQGLLHELELLGRHRRGFEKGTRRKAVCYLATFMARLGHPEADVLRAAEQLGRECRPRMPESEARSQARSGMKRTRKFPRNTTIADDLRVDMAEADLLQLRKLRPDYEPPSIAGRFQTRRDHAVYLFKQLIAQHGQRLPMTYEALHQHLVMNGVQAARGSVQNWLRKAGGSVVQARGPYKQASKQQAIDLDEGSSEPPN
jgi:hypothetical protein